MCLDRKKPLSLKLTARRFKKRRNSVTLLRKKSTNDFQLEALFLDNLVVVDLKFSNQTLDLLKGCNKLPDYCERMKPTIPWSLTSSRERRRNYKSSDQTTFQDRKKLPKSSKFQVIKSTFILIFFKKKKFSQKNDLRNRLYLHCVETYFVLYWQIVLI